MPSKACVSASFSPTSSDATSMAALTSSAAGSSWGSCAAVTTGALSVPPPEQPASSTAISAAIGARADKRALRARALAETARTSEV